MNQDRGAKGLDQNSHTALFDDDSTASCPEGTSERRGGGVHRRSAAGASECKTLYNLSCPDDTLNRPLVSQLALSHSLKRYCCLHINEPLVKSSMWIPPYVVIIQNIADLIALHAYTYILSQEVPERERERESPLSA